MKPFIQRMTHWWQLFTSRFSKSVEMTIVAVVLTMAYVLIFLLLQPIIGNIIASFSLVPVLLFAWLYGPKASIYATITSLIANFLLIAFIEQSFAAELLRPAIFGHVFILMAAIIAGKFSNLSKQLQNELQERVKIEQTLQASENRYRLISENLNDLICLHEQDSTIIYLSSSVEEMLGYSEKELLGQKPFQLYHPDDFTLFRSTDYLQAVEQEQDFTVEGRVRHKDGHYLWIESRMRPFVYANDENAYWQSITRDISELKARETALKAAKEEAEEATRTKSEFLANMSHEIRTPMNAIIGLTGLLLESSLDFEQRDFIETIRISGDGLLGIINDILDFSKIEAGKLELEHAPFNLRKCVEDALDMHTVKAREKGLNLAYRIDEQVPELVLGDMIRLRQILVNLLGNAVKFTSDGEVVLSVTSVEAKNAAKELCFSIVDTGIGIPPERMNRLFQSFSQVDSSTTRQYGGTGLGLVISKRLAEAMGGHMWVESEPGKGSTFCFTIVVSACDSSYKDKEVPETAVPVTSLDTPRQDLRILLAEDNAINQKVALRMLQRLGYSAGVAGNGHEVLAALQQQAYDIILMDVQMPQMDGLTATQLIRQNNTLQQRPYIIALTANALKGDRERFLEAGMDDYLSKPVRLEALAAAIAKCPLQPILDSVLPTHLLNGRTLEGKL
jgi:PAS domain S-box-containing protein